MLPVENLESSDIGKRSLTEYDPSPEEVFDGLVPQYLCGIFVRGLIVDSFCVRTGGKKNGYGVGKRQCGRNDKSAFAALLTVQDRRR